MNVTKKQIPAFYVKNHGSTDAFQLDSFDELLTKAPLPKFPSDDEYRKWMNTSSTDHVFYSLTKPANPDERASKTNLPELIYGIISDYDDAMISDEQKSSIKCSPGCAPAYITSTRSGAARGVYLFEEPIGFYSFELCKRFMQKLASELGLKGLLPGKLDEAFADPCHYYELGTKWISPFGSEARIPKSKVWSILFDVSAKAKFAATQMDNIPMDAVAAEIEKRWPGRWTGGFLEGSRGVRFWDPKADNPTGCMIFSNGAVAFTGEHRFLSWTEILGLQFVKKFREDRIGGAIENVYHDGRSFWQQDESHVWRPYSGEAIKRRLSVMYSLSTESKKGGPSEVSNAVTAIENLHSVDGAFPVLYNPETIVEDGGQKYINISRVKVVQPATDVVGRTWGQGFPWLADYLSQLFGQEQLDVFLSWLHRFYTPALEQSPRRGHALFIAGPPSAGKSFLAQRVIAGLVGGFREATDFVLGNTTFNEDLAFAPVWAIDDAVASSDPKRHSIYSQIVKKIVANPRIQFHPKFQKAVTLWFNGRLIVTLNDDPESIQMLPQVDQSLLDKLIILLASATKVSFRNAEPTVAQELPAFADYVRNFVIPDELLTNPDYAIRFGFDCYHHQDLLQTAKQSSSSQGLLELLEIWRSDYFNSGIKADMWEGNPTELMNELTKTEGLKELVHKICPARNSLGRDLQKLVNQECPWVDYHRTGAKRVYRISAPGKGAA